MTGATTRRRTSTLLVRGAGAEPRFSSIERKGSCFNHSLCFIASRLAILLEDFTCGVSPTASAILLIFIFIFGNAPIGPVGPPSPPSPKCRPEPGAVHAEHCGHLRGVPGCVPAKEDHSCEVSIFYSCAFHLLVHGGQHQRFYFCSGPTPTVLHARRCCCEHASWLVHTPNQAPTVLLELHASWLVHTPIQATVVTIPRAATHQGNQP